MMWRYRDSSRTSLDRTIASVRKLPCKQYQRFGNIALQPAESLSCCDSRHCLIASVSCLTPEQKFCTSAMQLDRMVCISWANNGFHSETRNRTTNVSGRKRLIDCFFVRTISRRDSKVTGGRILSTNKPIGMSGTERSDREWR